MHRVIRRLLVVLAIAGAGLVPAPAIAAGYCGGSGVNVVVDRGALGGGISKGCDSSGNRNAARAFENSGHHLSYAQRQPGFVCRVDGAPASDPCVNTSPANAYWGLYWSDGTSGWKYSSVAVGSLNVPAGATVAFSWQNGGTADPPGTAPAAPAPASKSPSPTASPKPKPKPTPTRAPGSATPRASSAGTPTAAPTSSRAATTSAPASPTASTSAPTTAASTAAAAPTTSAPEVAAPVTTRTASASTSEDHGLPWWLPVGLVVVLAGASGVVWQVRRARG